MVGVSVVKGLYKPNDYDNSPLIIHVNLMGIWMNMMINHWVEWVTHVFQTNPTVIPCLCRFFFIWVNHETSSSAWICLAFLGDPPLFPLTASSWFPPLFTYQPTYGFRRINSNTWKKMRLWEQQQWTYDSHDIYGQWSDIWARMWYLGWCKPVSRGVRVWMSKKSGVNLAIYGDLTIKRRNLTNIRKDACPKIWHRHWLHCLVVLAVAIWHTGRKILENHHCQCLQDATSAC